MSGLGTGTVVASSNDGGSIIRLPADPAQQRNRVLFIFVVVVLFWHAREDMYRKVGSECMHRGQLELNHRGLPPRDTCGPFAKGMLEVRIYVVVYFDELNDVSRLLETTVGVELHGGHMHSMNAAIE